MNDRLRLLSGNEPLVLNPTDGEEVLAQATDVFRYNDRNFEHWNCNIVGLPTKETAVQVYEMVRDSTFQELFGGFGVALDCLALTQAQIRQFVKHHGDWLKKGGNGTFFLFKVGNEFLWQQRTSSRTVVLVCACAALLLSEFSGHKSA
jgi:hypothetical protein